MSRFSVGDLVQTENATIFLPPFPFNTIFEVIDITDSWHGGVVDRVHLKFWGNPDPIFKPMEDVNPNRAFAADWFVLANEMLVIAIASQG